MNLSSNDSYHDKDDGKHVRCAHNVPCMPLATNDEILRKEGGRKRVKHCSVMRR